MTARSEFETRIIDALESLRNKTPVFTETLVFNGAGGAANYEDFGDGWSDVIKAPDGHVGRVVGVSIYGVTENFNAVTTAARVDVGTAANTDLYYRGSAITATTTTADNPEGTFRGLIPAGEDFVVTGVAPTGGTPAGRARVAVTIEWYQE